MMKKKLTIITMAVCAAACLLGGISSAAAWFVRRTTVGDQDDLIGESQGAYFARGEGTYEKPFIINKPIHLYNLAWLQYIGYFNDSNAPYYFALDPKDDQTTLDMTGWVLPPIGTSLYPFIGNFEGNGETIANLTTDNKIGSDHIVKTPTLINASSTSNGILKVYKKAAGNSPAQFKNYTVDCVGMFGIVGGYAGMETVSVDYQSANALSHFALNGSTVSSSSSSALVGIVCGYDNATLAGVAVDNSTMNVAAGTTPSNPSLTSNISDHSLVGYATSSAMKKCYLNDVEAKLPSIDNPNTISGGTSWGGSIDMLTIYNRLKSVRDTADILGYYNTENKIDGQTTYSDFTQISDSVELSGTMYYVREEGKQYSENGEVYASFNFKRRSTSSTFASYADNESGGEGYTYGLLTGSRTFNFQKNTNKIDEVTSNPSDFRISTDGVNFLSVSGYGGSISNQTAYANASTWNWYNTSYLRTRYNNRNYYLSVSDSGVLSVGTNATTQWTYDSSSHNLYCVVNGETYYLVQKGTTWAVQAKATTYYTISSGNHYMQHDVLNGIRYMRTVDSYSSSDDTIRWYKSGNNFYSTKTFTFGIRAYNNQYVVFTDSTSYSLLNYSAASGSLDDDTSTGYLKSGNYYAFYNSGQDHPWMFQTTSSPLTFTKYSPAKEPDHGIKFYSWTSSTGNATYTTYPTYFPLLMEPDTLKPMDGYQADENSQKQFNTGYVVSGPNVSTGNAYQDLAGDVRFAGYPYDASGNSTTDSLRGYTSGKKIYTRTNYLNGQSIASSGWTTINGASTSFNGVNTYKLAKLKNSYANLVDTLSTSAKQKYIFGVHFMDCEISIDRLVSIGNAKVLDSPAIYNEETRQYEDHISTYHNYQAPQDSIDFHLKSQGFINFFAGTYYVSGTTNNSFFSLHEIVRDSSNKSVISEIKHITKIYAPDYKDASGNYMPANEEHPYIYKYSDNSYSSNTAPSESQLLFDCAWIEDPNNAGTALTNYALYYFEIPVNAGEYALGSVASRSGAYLVYLDIGAGNTNFKDVTIEEDITYTYLNVSFPVGVDFADLSGSNSTTKIATATGGNSACVKVANATNGIAISFSYSTDDEANTNALALTKSGNDPPDMEISTFDVSFQEYNVTTSYLGTEYSLDLLSSEYTIHLKREIAETFNPSVGTGTESVVYTELYTISTRPSGTKIQLPNIGGASAHWSVITGNATVSDAGLVVFSAENAVSVQSTWITSTEVGENWAPFDSNNIKGDESDPILRLHFLDHSEQSDTVPNIVLSFAYSESGNGTNAMIYYYDVTIYNTDDVDVNVVIDAFKSTYENEPNSTYVVRLHYGATTTNVSAVDQTIVIPPLGT